MPRTKPNISQLAREHGLNPKTVYGRMRKGMTLEQALSKPRPIAQIAREHGLEPRIVQRRVLKGMSIEEAVNKPKKSVDQKNIADLAREHGLNPKTVYGRMRKGMTLEQALNEPLENSSTRLWRESAKRAWRDNREEMLKTIRLSKLKVYVAISPKGEQIEIDDLPKFCEEHDLPYSSVSNATRRRKPYRGWLIKPLLEDSYKASQPTE